MIADEKIEVSVWPTAGIILTYLLSFLHMSDVQMDEHMEDAQRVDISEQARLELYLALAPLSQETVALLAAPPTSLENEMQDPMSALADNLQRLDAFEKADEDDYDNECCDGDYTHDDDCDEYYYRGISPHPQTPVYPLSN